MANIYIQDSYVIYTDIFYVLYIFILGNIGIQFFNNLTLLIVLLCGKI